MRVRFAPQALRNLRTISNYVKVENPLAADRISSALRIAAEGLSTFPYSGRKQTSAGLRKLVVVRYRYIIYYRVEAESDTIEIIGIRHASRSRTYRDL